MLALMIGSSLALAGRGELVPNEEPVPTTQYEQCRVRVLVDRTQQKAWAFRMIFGTQDVDLNSGAPLELQPADDLLLGDTNAQKASLPFDVTFHEVYVTDDSVFGQIPNPEPLDEVLVPGHLVYLVSVEGSKQYIYQIEAGAYCGVK